MPPADFNQPAPPDLIAFARHVLDSRGMQNAEIILRMSKPTILAVVANQRVTRGTIALLREAFSRREAA